MAKEQRRISEQTLRTLLQETEAEEIQIFRTAAAVEQALAEGRLDQATAESFKLVLSRPGEIGVVRERCQPPAQPKRPPAEEDVAFLFQAPTRGH